MGRKLEGQAEIQMFLIYNIGVKKYCLYFMEQKMEFSIWL